MQVDPYETIAEFYEAEYGPLEADVAFFSRSVRGGRLLVLGCGTGRVARRLADGRAVVGLDRSAPMLAVGRRLAPTVDFVDGDMRSFSVGTFREILIPNSAFAFLETRADQHACLTACRRALDSDGVLTIDLPMPTFGLWAQTHQPPALAWEGIVQHRRCWRMREIHRNLPLQRLSITDTYYDESQPLPLATSAFSLRVTLPGELEWMLEACGFYVDELLGNYNGESIRHSSPRILARARPLP